MGVKALRLACINGHFEVVKILVENGADIHVENDRPLFLAKENKHAQIEEWLRTVARKEKIQNLNS